MTAPSVASDCFVTEAGPPTDRRRAYIYRDPEGSSRTVRGWCFVVETIDAGGEAQPLGDTWEESFEEIMRYPPEWLTGQIEWRDRATGDIVLLEP